MLYRSCALVVCFVMMEDVEIVIVDRSRYQPKASYSGLKGSYSEKDNVKILLRGK